jgi:hypothetical protein
MLIEFPTILLLGDDVDAYENDYIQIDVSLYGVPAKYRVEVYKAYADPEIEWQERIFEFDTEQPARDYVRSLINQYYALGYKIRSPPLRKKIEKEALDLAFGGELTLTTTDEEQDNKKIRRKVIL